MEKTTSNYLQHQEQQQQMIMKCPRCDSSNTKFCYYNNYSLSQPRHFCKACKRYWTRGGTLRNVPVGGGCRKNKKHLKKHPQPTKTTTTSFDIPVSVPNPTTTNTNTIDMPTNSTTVLYGLPTLGFGRLGFSSDSYNYNMLNSASDIESYGFQRPYQKLAEGLEIKTDHPNKLELWEDIHDLHDCQNQMGQMINPGSIQHHSSSLYWNPQMTNWLDPSTLDYSNTT